MSQYQYSLSTYFPGGYNTSQLFLLIREELPLKIISVYTNDDSMYIVTSSELTGGELSTLDGIISAYVYSEESYEENDQYIIEPAIIYPATATNGYTRIATFRWPGSTYQTLIKLVLKSWVDSGRTYNIKLQNYDTGAIIYESANMSNTSLVTNVFTTGFANIPTSQQYINLLVKMNGATSSKKYMLNMQGYI
jgi:hypothetical protein